MITRSYSEMIRLSTFEERFAYLKCNGSVGKDTFGYWRRLNQLLYTSQEWKQFKKRIIIRDGGCDLAMVGFEICAEEPIYIHHINPLTIDDVRDLSPAIFDPDNVVCTRFHTHNAIHYGDVNQLILAPNERTPNDTCPWRRTT